MRYAFAVSCASCFLFLSLVPACSSKKLLDTCPTVSSTGTASHCIVSAQCIGTNTGVQLDCSGADGNCVCSENGVVGATVPYESSFCEQDDASDSQENALEAANDACKWKL